jgi:hypothetical protein
MGTNWLAQFWFGKWSLRQEINWISFGLEFFWAGTARHCETLGTRLI